jgi:hypothetical protein
VPGDVLERIILRVCLRARRRAGWLAELRGETGALLDHPADEAAWMERDATASSFASPLAEVEQAFVLDRGSRLAALEGLFALEPQESDVLQAALAVDLAPELQRLLSSLHELPGRSWLTESIVARLFGHGRRRVFLPDSPLRRWGLVHEESLSPGEPRALVIDPQVRDWLCGQHRLDASLVAVSQLVPAHPPLAGWPVEAIVGRAERVLEGGGKLRVRVSGVPGSGRRTLAAVVAGRLGLPLLAIDADRIEESDWPRVFVRAQRQAFLDRCALAWLGESLPRRAWPDFVPGFPLQFVISEGAEPLPQARELIEHLVEVPIPPVAERRALWLKHVPAAGSWPAEELSQLASRHRLSVGEFVELGHRGVGSIEEAALSVRESSRHRLGELARWVECPFEWDDLVLPEPLRLALADFTYEARARADFWEQPNARRLFPQGQALLALFSGTPGTGKTMAAQVLARRLGLDLFRISLASVVSKYVGETSRNLQRILSRAERMDAVLLFDEADALFGKRTKIEDAQDRFANTDTNYLLQAIEGYGGIALLATNKKGNIDPAFIRRLRFVLDFPRPELQERRRLWERLLRELGGHEARAGALDVLSGLDASGAQIKYALLAALFVARQEGRPLGMGHIVRGLQRELLKEGRGLDERERERMLSHEL